MKPLPASSELLISPSRMRTVASGVSMNQTAVHGLTRLSCAPLPRTPSRTSSQAGTDGVRDLRRGFTLASSPWSSRAGSSWSPGSGMAGAEAAGAGTVRSRPVSVLPADAAVSAADVRPRVIGVGGVARPDSYWAVSVRSGVSGSGASSERSSAGDVSDSRGVGDRVVGAGSGQHLLRPILDRGCHCGAGRVDDHRRQPAPRRDQLGVGDLVRQPPSGSVRPPCDPGRNRQCA